MTNRPLNGDEDHSHPSVPSYARPTLASLAKVHSKPIHPENRRQSLSFGLNSAPERRRRSYGGRKSMTCSDDDLSGTKRPYIGAKFSDLPPEIRLAIFEHITTAMDAMTFLSLDKTNYHLVKEYPVFHLTHFTLLMGVCVHCTYFKNWQHRLWDGIKKIFFRGLSFLVPSVYPSAKATKEEVRRVLLEIRQLARSVDLFSIRGQHLGCSDRCLPCALELTMVFRALLISMLVELLRDGRCQMEENCAEASSGSG
ncbi:hypothetical protein BJ508DRAFT_327473 [Ascobolus immersus RN42]|uniref:F-box domain-containing protein n=1 Tax=Ascobolus immersus RN42 TaxID=1160509 RepID=A0A3N4IF89_ASCIM|nr:hypothetical protein BJ508DRAFT_327473 [Ascobolus immersus RN42]